MLRAVPALAAMLLLAGCGGEIDPARTPAGFAELKVMEDLYDGRLNSAYDSLHPAHQKIVSRSSFIYCARRTVPIGDLDSIEILDVFDETVRVPALGEQKTKAVRVRVTLTDGPIKPFVQHEVKVGDRWRWVLNDDAARAFRAHRCPGL